MRVLKNPISFFFFKSIYIWVWATITLGYRNLFCSNWWDSPTRSQECIKEALGVYPWALSIQLMQFLLVPVALLVLCQSSTGIFAGARSPRAQGLASFGVPCGHCLCGLASSQDTCPINWKIHPFCFSFLVLGNIPLLSLSWTSKTSLFCLCPSRSPSIVTFSRISFDKNTRKVGDSFSSFPCHTSLWLKKYTEPVAACLVLKWINVSIYCSAM